VIGHVELLAASLLEYAETLRAALLHHADRSEDLRAPR
jgi:hypothetical protein